MIENRKPAFDQARQEEPAGIFKEFFLFLRHNKKYWIIPLLIALVVLALVLLLGGTSVAPFIYRLF